MKRLLGVLLVSSLPFVMTATVPAQAAHPASAVAKKGKVKIVNFAFKPGVLNIKKGMTVVWKNTTTSTTHTSSSDTGVWDSGFISPGMTFKFKFTSDGTFTYHCNVHPTMKGSIVVTG